jgi:integrase
MADNSGLKGLESKASGAAGSNLAVSARTPRRTKGWIPWNEVKRLPQRQSGKMIAIGPNTYLDMRKGQVDLAYRYSSNGTQRLKSLGPLHLASPEELRDRVHELDRKRRDGIDPLEEAREQKQAVLLARGKAKTFAEVAQVYLAANEAGWKNDKHRAQWHSTLTRYADPVIGKLPIDTIDINHVLQILEPLWARVPETGSRLRGRLEVIFELAIARKWRTAENPALWKRLKAAGLKTARKVRPIRHYAALPYHEMPEFMAKLRQQAGTAAWALEWTILHAARSGETRGALWREFNKDRSVWTIPAERTKTKKEHRVPLLPAAQDILRIMESYRGSDDDLVFPGRDAGTLLSDMTLAAVLKRMGYGHITVHGFRSSFRDWAAELTQTDNHVAEMALGHAIGSAVETAYRRGDLLTKRIALMGAWHNYCAANAR